MRSMTVDKDGDSLAVVFSGRSISDEVRIMEIGDDLAGIASTMENGQALVLDLQGVEYFSTAVVGQFVRLRTATERIGVEVRLRNISPTIQAILQTMHLDKVFRVDNSNA